MSAERGKEALPFVVLEPTENRRQITNLMEAYNYDQIGDLESAEIAERMSPDEEWHRAGEYVFGDVMDETWAPSGQRVPGDLWDNEVDFLARSRYVPVHKPQAGDIVAYAVLDLGELYPTSQETVNWMADKRRYPYFEHFGVLEEDGRVRSKFSTGHVYRHRLEDIPLDWGSAAFFFRKVPSKLPVSSDGISFITSQS